MTANSSKLLYQRSGTAKSLAGRSGEQHTTIGGKHAKKFGRRPGARRLRTRDGGTGHKRGTRRIRQRLIRPNAHKGIAVHIDHQHEHAVRILILPCRKRPFNVLFGP